ncbi:MAG: UvrD-helicase domain-containing protein [Candidatus Kapabacteria bacterium]|nr:UvrD-helicase domain-containing protein [Candidatus Kapabacteria bacterium]
MAKLTREQSIALSLDRNMCVTANAGSGKTTVLVQKFLKIILDESLNIDPRRVVAITFTKKAASEMLTKVVKKLEEAIYQETDFSKLKRLRKIRESMTYARISTIHSFCGSILRDFPIEADVSPFYYELSNSELLTIKRNAILSTFEQWLESDDDNKKLRAKNLFRELGRFKVQSIVETLLNKRDILENLENLYKNSNDFILNNIYSFICSKINESGRLMHSLVSDFYRLDIKLSSDKDSNVGFLLDNILIDLEIEELINTDKHQRHIEDLKANFKLLFTDEGRVNKNFKKKSKMMDEEEVILNIYGEKIVELLNFLQILSDCPLDEKVIDYAKTILAMVKDINEIIEAEKQEINGLDFDDLLIKTRELLKNKYILGKVRRNIDYLLVDEFQDTNFIQYDIIKDIITEIVEEKIAPNTTQLFIVGDAKQSIYGFRNSDVRVFNQALTDIKKINQMKLERGLINDVYLVNNQKINSKNDEEAQGDIKLTATFRLQPVIASFVDIVCGKLMKESANLYDIKYEPFICARNVESVLDLNNQEQRWSGAVDFLLSFRKSNDENDSSEEIIGEAENITKFILNAVYGENPLQVMDENGNMRNVQFKDIAVLSRKRAGFSSLAESFLNSNIPFVVHSGSGFYQTQEITDLISLLYFIHNKNDDLSLVALLRSPFFDVDDLTLLKISKTEGETYWEKLINYTNIKNTDTYTNSLRAYLILREFIKLADRIPIYKLLAKFLQDAAWFGTVSNKSGEKQIIANIEKFLNFAREFDSRGFRNFYDFINEVKFITENEIDESESVFITDDDVVNVMTVHASKGLEFPVVILQGTNSEAKKNEGFVISPELGLWFPVQKLNEKNYPEQCDSPSYLITKEERKQIEYAEEKRLLYVALTRAKDYLVISAELKLNKDNKVNKPSGFFKMLMKALNYDINKIYDDESIDLKNNLLILVDNEPKEINHEFKVNIKSEIKDTKGIASLSEKKEDEKILNIREIFSNIEYLNYSPTKIQNFLDDEKYFRLKYLLGLPIDAESNQIFFQDSELDEESGMIFGTLLHKVLERINIWLKSDLSIDIELLKNTINSVIPFNLINSKNLAENLLSEAQKVANSKFIKDNYENIINGKSEYSLTIPIHNDFLNAKIDLLLKNFDGNYEIWDWKTNTIQDNEHKERLIAHYEFQMKVYAFLISKIFNQKEYLSRLLFTKLADNNVRDEEWTHKYIWTKEDLDSFEDELIEQIKIIPRI